MNSNLIKLTISQSFKKKQFYSKLMNFVLKKLHFWKKKIKDNIVDASNLFLFQITPIN